MSLTASQRRQAIGLYRRLLKTGQSTFSGDAEVIAAWHQRIRHSFTDPQQISGAGSDAVDAKFQEWEDVITILKKNIVQGKRRADSSDAYELRITRETELGSNESVKEGRKKQLDALAASKGASSRCSGASSSRASLSTSSASYSTLAGSWTRRHAASSSSGSLDLRRMLSSCAAVAAKATSATLPSPIPHFQTTTILSDGSTVQTFSTSPRDITRLTRDVTNHPLWNPALNKRGPGQGSGADGEEGRLGRFRRRFAEEGASASSASASGAQMRFGEEDLAWMSVGGRQARAGTPITKAKAKGKGKK